jgi:hypothetical protein
MFQLSATRPRKGAQIDRVTVIRLAGLVPCDPRTVQKYIHGGATSHVARAGIQRAMQALGVPDPRA